MEGEEGTGRPQDSLRAKVTNLFPWLMMTALGVVPALVAGLAWVASPLSIMISVLVPLMVVGMAIPDSFAGERELRKLRALLATRLSDQAILFGKMAVPVLDALGVAAAVHLIGLVTLNVAHWQGSIVVYTLPVGLTNAAITVLLALLAASLGVLISLRAASVQQATQALMIVSVTPIWLAWLAAMLIGTVFPQEWRAAFERWFEAVVLTADLGQVIVVIVCILTAVDLTLLMAAMRGFRRSRLIAC